MSTFSQVPQPAQCHEYDSECGEIPRSKIEARRKKPASTRTPGTMMQLPQRRREPTPSDSGYSSHASGPAKSDPSQALVRQTPTTQPLSKSSKQPVIQRRDSGRGPPVLSQGRCSDPNCRNPDCSSTWESTDRAPPVSPLPQPVQFQQSLYPPTAEAQYMQQGQFQQSFYPQYSHMASGASAAAPQTMPQPIPQAVPRPRTGSHTRQRPVSIYGTAMPSFSSSYDDSQRGPPPSSSAFYVNTPYYPPPAASYHSSTPPDPTSLHSYFQGAASPTTTSSSLAPGAYPGSAGLPGMYSTRHGNPALPGLLVPKLPGHPPLSRAPSARRSERETPRSVPPPQVMESDPESDDNELFEEVTYAIGGGRGSQDVVLARARRPSMGKSHTTPLITSHPKSEFARRRGSIHRAPRSDSDLDYYSSDHIDSDRTHRAVVATREGHSNRSSRRPSVSTNASSGRTKATTLSSESDYIIEDRKGRHTAYRARMQTDTLRQLQRFSIQDHPLDELDEKERQIADYQRQTGGESFDLTAENIRQQSQQKRRSGSHFTGARTHKSSGSGSRASRPNDGGIRIESGGTVLHVYGGAQIEMRHSEDGGPAHLVVNSASGRDSGYHGSSRSSDGLGRSRISTSDAGRPRRQKQIIYEDHEGEYEIAR